LLAYICCKNDYFFYWYYHYYEMYYFFLTIDIWEHVPHIYKNQNDYLYFGISNICLFCSIYAQAHNFPIHIANLRKKHLLSFGKEIDCVYHSFHAYNDFISFWHKIIQFFLSKCVHYYFRKYFTDYIIILCCTTFDI